MSHRFAPLALLALCLSLGAPLSGCSRDGGGTPEACGESSCPGGCCDASGQCQPGPCATPPPSETCTSETREAFCGRLGKNCDTVSGRDNCGRWRNESCGTCAAPLACGVSGTPNVCGCTGEPDATLCQAAGKTCDAVTLTDRCGVSRTVTCGTCSGRETCGGGGTANVCGCSPETDAQLCARRGANCDTVSERDNCGAWRSVNCGTCTAPETCGGGDVRNVCACRPETVQDLCRRVGAQCGQVTATDTCGTQRTVSCGGCSYPKTCNAVNACLPPPDVMTEPFVEAGLGWQWMAPLPYPGRLEAVRVVGNGEVWVGGQTGLLLRWDGTRWSQVATPTTQTLRALWASSATDVWAVGEGGVVLRWNGTSVSLVPSGTTANLRAIWGRSAQDVWVVAVNGAILRWDGRAFTQAHLSSMAGLTAITGNAAGELWAVGGVGTVLHYNGSTWAQEPTPTDQTLFSVDLGANGEVWAVGSASILRRIQGIWYAQPLPSSISGSLYRVWVTPEGEVRVGTSRGYVYRYNPSSSGWQLLTFRGDEELLDMHGASGADMWMVGERGSISRYLAGTGKGTYDISSNVPESLGANSFRVHDVSTPSSTELLIGGTATAWDYSTNRLETKSMVKLWDAASGQWRHVGAPWADVVGKVWASPSAAYAVAIDDLGDRLGEFSAGSVLQSWTQVSTCDTVVGGYAAGYSAIHGTSATDVWVTMDRGGTLCHRTDKGWSRVGSGTTQPLYDLWMVSPTAGFAVGDEGTTLRYLGGSWLSMPSGTTQRLTHVWAPSETSAWALSDSGALWRWNGTTWAGVPLTGVKGGPSGLWGTGDADVWLITNEGLAHWDGRAWSNVRLPVYLRRIHGTSATHAFAVDDQGAILRRR